MVRNIVGGLGLCLLVIQPVQAERVRCKNLKTPEQVIAAYNAGATYLDKNGDGYACESTLNVYVLDSTRSVSFGKRPATLTPSPNTVASNNTAHLTLGMPSPASLNPEDYLLIKPYYALSYNSTKGLSNWVSWQLNASWIGGADRQNDFRPDATLPTSFTPITPDDYTGSGYDRGHLCPSADRTRDLAMNSATFLMSNMTPQTPDLNRGPWEKLESYSRKLVSQGKELYIIAGVAGTQGSLLRGKVTVPDRNWKVVVILDQPGLGVAGITSETRIIAVNMPNTRGIKNTGWGQYLTTVDQIEQMTGYDLLSNVSPEIQAVIESRTFTDNR
jgi:endonuclease G, mitochondrial